ncbi:hypothetical protein GTG28_00120 [Vibrio sp. OCN044]|uniref:TadE-like domain-containing protein n=1 Tax=Vibrio tetraodonis subsp. pristinus TaxID=2695891 RepID=A0A6L8LNR7_9VIBR|nr:TadE family protein [Vibrio tetraodonis]MYM57638.1 hypothetical protein [Vibrio tetraodonis subsp. pristinus]
MKYCLSKKYTAGFAAVELTILTPFIMLLLFIAVDYGRVMSEVIVSNSSTGAAVGFGSMHNRDFDEELETTGMSSIALKDAQDLTLNSGETSKVSVDSLRVCRCYDPDADSLPEPTADTCSVTCDHNKEVYIQTSLTRNFKPFSGHKALPTSVPLNRTARFRVE